MLNDASEEDMRKIIANHVGGHIEVPADVTSAPDISAGDYTVDVSMDLPPSPVALVAAVPEEPSLDDLKDRASLLFKRLVTCFKKQIKNHKFLITYF